MDFQCAMCQDALPPENEFAKCRNCKCNYHYTCAGVREIQYRKQSAEAKANWKCAGCRTRSASTGSVGAKTEDAETSSQTSALSPDNVEAIMNIVRAVIKDENKVLIDKMNTFQTSIDYYSQKLDEFTMVITKLQDENKQLDKRCLELTTKCASLEQQCEKMQSTMEENIQYTRNRNLQINGVPETAGEDVTQIVCSIGRSTGLQIAKGDLQAAHRVNSRNPTNRMNIRTIVVQFDKRPLRDEFLNKCKSRRPTTGAVFNDATTGAIYVNEHLTPFYRSLYNEAKFKSKENGERFYKYVWFKNGKLFVRRGDNTTIERILNSKDI